MFVCRSCSVCFKIIWGGISSPNGWRLGIFLSYGMMAMSDDKFAADSGVAHPVLNMVRSRAAFV